MEYYYYYMAAIDLIDLLAVHNPTQALQNFHAMAFVYKT